MRSWCQQPFFFLWSSPSSSKYLHHYLTPASILCVTKSNQSSLTSLSSPSSTQPLTHDPCALPPPPPTSPPPPPTSPSPPPLLHLYLHSLFSSLSVTTLSLFSSFLLSHTSPPSHPDVSLKPTCITSSINSSMPPSHLSLSPINIFLHCPPLSFLLITQ